MRIWLQLRSHQLGGKRRSQTVFCSLEVRKWDKEQLQPSPEQVLQSLSFKRTGKRDSSCSKLDFSHTLGSSFVPDLHEGRGLISRQWPIRVPILCSLRKALISNSYLKRSYSSSTSSKLKVHVSHKVFNTLSADWTNTSYRWTISELQAKRKKQKTENKKYSVSFSYC